MHHTSRFLSLLCIPILLSSCAYTSYLAESVYEGGKILANREDIGSVLKSDDYTAQEKEKLKLVVEARLFAQSIGLDTGESFTKYTKVDRDVLLWVLVALRPTSFTPYVWWFPVVGYVPYRGFFDKEDALEYAKVVNHEGFEYTIRGAQAFSTLGWFNDPVLSTTLNAPDTRVVNTVIHESLHRTVWIPNHVDFNESLANFVGFMGAIQFYKRQGDPEKAIVEKNREWEIADTTLTLYDELDRLYKSYAPEPMKLQLRVKIFDRSVAPLRAKYPEMTIYKNINNAEIVQLKLYMTGLRDFEKLFIKTGENWGDFLREIKKIRNELKDNPEKNPFDLLKAKTN